jgi:hypothetical protein
MIDIANGSNDDCYEAKNSRGDLQGCGHGGVLCALYCG